MRTLTLLLCLAALPSLAADGEVAKTVDYGKLLKADVADFSVEGMSRTELMKLRFQLQEERPGVVSPLAMLGGGGVLAFLGLGLSVTAAIMGSGGDRPFGQIVDDGLGNYGPAFTPGGILSVTVGIAMVLGGAALLFFGGRSLADALPARRAAGFKMNLIDTELDKLGPAAP